MTTGKKKLNMVSWYYNFYYIIDYKSSFLRQQLNLCLLSWLQRASTSEERLSAYYHIKYQIIQKQDNLDFIDFRAHVDGMAHPRS